MKLHPGSVCSCSPRRYVRFVIPAVPGCKPVISCRDAEGTGPKSLAEHDIPADAEIMIRTPGFVFEASLTDTVAMTVGKKRESASTVRARQQSANFGVRPIGVVRIDPAKIRNGPPQRFIDESEPS